MSVAVQGEFRQLNPAVLSFSKSSAQAERRKHFDKEQMKELVDSVTEKGIVQPIVVRPLGGEDFEVVAGERRVKAALEAGLPLVPAMVHELTDEQALDLQLIENLQREGLHPLVECEGYEDLKKRGHSIDEIAERVGKSTSYIYKRLELERCGKKVRSAFYEGTLDASKALVLSRLPEKLQEKALEDLTTGWLAENPLSYREFFGRVQREFMLRLDQAPFKTEDAELVPDAGACGSCPKNTVQLLGLFGDVSRDALCTDRVCFKSKVTAGAAKRVAAAEAANQVVIKGKEAKNALDTYGSSSEYARLDQHVDGNWSNPTFQKALGRDVSKVIAVVVDPKDGRAIELVDKKAAKKLLKEKGIKLQRGEPSTERSAKDIEKDKAEKAKREAEEKLNAAVMKAIYEKEPAHLDRDELADIARILVEGSVYRDPLTEHVFGKGKKPNLKQLYADGLTRVIRTYLLADTANSKTIAAAAKRHGVNVEKIKLELAAPKVAKLLETPAPAKKKAAKKK